MRSLHVALALTAARIALHRLIDEATKLRAYLERVDHIARYGSVLPRLRDGIENRLQQRSVVAHIAGSSRAGGHEQDYGERRDDVQWVRVDSGGCEDHGRFDAGFR